MTPTGQVTITSGTMIMKFPIGNTLIIQEMIDRLGTQTPSLPTYRATVKAFVELTAAEALVRETTMKKLKEAAANKKKRSKKNSRVNCGLSRDVGDPSTRATRG
jgi:hypothetical protein